MKIKISNFKSIDLAEIDLAPLTLLIGPPASGKSNLLDALALIGYFERFLLLDKEYQNNTSNLEPLTLISRFDKHDQLFRYHDLTRKVDIEVMDREKQEIFSIGFEGGRPLITLNNINIPWDLINLNLYINLIQDIRNSLNQASNGKLIGSRLYGYDRYGLATSTCTSAEIAAFTYV